MGKKPAWYDGYCKLMDIAVPMWMGIALTVAFTAGLSGGFVICWLFGSLYLFGRWNR